MSDSSNIEWTDATWNPVVGCSPVSEGCRNCYAATMARRLEAMGQQAYKARPDRGLQQIQREDNVGLGAAMQRQKAVRIAEVRGGRAVFTGEVRTVESRLDDPLRWRKPRRVFVCSMSDLFHPKVPFEFIDRVFAVMALCPHHTFQVLTKRPERMADYVTRLGKHHERDPVSLMAKSIHANSGQGSNGFAWRIENGRAFLPNVWLGTSCEDQAAADERIPHLLQCPAAVRFLSCEPLLGPIDLEHTLWNVVDEPTRLRFARRFDATTVQVSPLPGIDWVIVGGESGPRARSCDVAWIQHLIRQCRGIVPCFVKQLGSEPRVSHLTDPREVPFYHRGGFLAPWVPEWAAAWIRKFDRKGGDPAEWPEDLRVREFPKAVGGAA